MPGLGFLWRPRATMGDMSLVVDGRAHAGPVPGPDQARPVLLALAALSLVVMILTLINGSLTVRVLGITLFKNHHLIRPGAVAAVLTEKAREQVPVQPKPEAAKRRME